MVLSCHRITSWCAGFTCNDVCACIFKHIYHFKNRQSKSMISGMGSVTRTTAPRAGLLENEDLRVNV